jgi:glycosyltransferase involved in cell wall biosynthesis
VGEGPCRDRLEGLGRHLAPGRVRFLPPVEETAPVLVAADVIVLPSLTEEFRGC